MYSSSLIKRKNSEIPNLLDGFLDGFFLVTSKISCLLFAREMHKDVPDFFDLTHQFVSSNSILHILHTYTIFTFTQIPHPELQLESGYCFLFARMGTEIIFFLAIFE